MPYKQLTQFFGSKPNTPLLAHSAPYMRLQELRSNTHLGVMGPQKWPLSLKKGKRGRQKIKS